MRAIVKGMTAVAVVVACESAVYAASDAVRCDSVKALAAGTLFKSIMLCNHRAFADNTFDVGVCRTNAYEKCVAKFQRADLIYGAGCVFTGNGPTVCQETLNSANTIWDDV
ncbi:MAG TPA: hypothetical protein VFD92_02590 [Candidatus Binatia bacterium]|nr:hypothetical protein [Candidatus Binatia bacterium]